MSRPGFQHACLLVLLWSCRRESNTDTGNRWITLGFAEACQASRRVSLPINDTVHNPSVIDRIVPLSGSAFLAPDPLAGRILWFDSTGRSAHVLGRTGDGPGEFRTPTDVTVLDDSLLAVVDIQRMLVTVLDTAGRYLRSFPTPRLGGHRIMATRRGHLAVAGLYDLGGKNQLLAVYDRAGAFLQSALDFPPLIAQSSPPIDDAVLAATSNGSLVYVSAILPTAWLIEGQDTRRITFTPPRSWVQIQPLRTRPERLQQVRDWMGSGSFMTGGGLVSDSVLLVGWRNGATTEGPSHLALVSLSQPRMVLIENAPGRLVGVQGTQAILVVEEGGTANVLSWFRCDAALEGL